MMKDYIFIRTIKKLFLHKITVKYAKLDMLLQFSLQ